MSNVLVRVTAQYFNENGRPKGRQEFEFRADSDLFMMADPEYVKIALQVMIDKTWEGWAGNCEYREHDVIFNDIMELQGDLGEILSLVYADKDSKSEGDE